MNSVDVKLKTNQKHLPNLLIIISSLVPGLQLTAIERVLIKLNSFSMINLVCVAIRIKGQMPADLRCPMMSFQTAGGV